MDVGVLTRLIEQSTRSIPCHILREDIGCKPAFAE